MGFCTVEDVEQFLQIEVTEAQADSVERAIEEATSAIQNYCRQTIALVEDDEITLDCAGGTKLFLPELPVVEVSEVVEDLTELVQGTDYKLGQFGILHRVGRRWSTGVQNIEVIYSHGYETLPDDVIGVATRAAARAYQAGLRAAESEAIPGVASKQLGDYSVSFGSEQSVGAGEAVLGASASPVLLRSEKEFLERYRLKV